MGTTESQMMNAKNRPHNANIYVERPMWIASEFNTGAANKSLFWVMYLWQEEPLLS